ncbi:hypothetical protein [Planomonospora sp. ID82291]|uniref:hypothetical protein n=1 Tax=Planomonospora sp. ID82291 TaxID=2738136 RepID=UPI0018C39825|nr:hypothetical protein [Planomonospora sp. ID82291]MBG0818197.1 hypothetical protein [Planomonospora sp. ID82291]
MNEHQDIVRQAEADARQARELADAIAERVTAGDATVTPQELAEARSLAEFAALRVEAARRQAEAAHLADIDARGKALAAEVARLVDTDESEIAVLFRKAVEAVEALVQAGEDRRRQVRTAADLIGVLSADLKAAGVEGGTRARFGLTGDANTVTMFGETVKRARSVPGRDLVSAAVGMAVDKYTVGEVLRSPRVARHVMGMLPVVAEDWRVSREDLPGLGEHARWRAHEFGLVAGRDDAA